MRMKKQKRMGNCKLRLMTMNKIVLLWCTAMDNLDIVTFLIYMFRSIVDAFCSSESIVDAFFCSESIILRKNLIHPATNLDIRVIASPLYAFEPASLHAWQVMQMFVFL